MKAYESEPLPITFDHVQYADGTRDVVFVHERYNKSFPAKQILDFIKSDNQSTKVPTQTGRMYDYVPTRTFTIPVDSSKVLEEGVVKPENAQLIENQLQGRFGNRLTKSDMIVLDIIANNNWERPIYFVAYGHSGMLGLDDYLQLEGLAYRLVPIKTPSRFDKGRIDTEILYENYMNTFTWGRMNEPDVYLDHFHLRTLNVIRLRPRYTRLANALIAENEYEKAENVLDYIVDLTPHEQVPYDFFIPGIVESYYNINKIDKANELASKMMDISIAHLDYYLSMNRKARSANQQDILIQFQVLSNIGQMARQNNQVELADKALNYINEHQDKMMF